MEDHIATLESQFLSLKSIGSKIEDPMIVAILLSSILELKEYNAVVTLIITLKDKLTKWSYVSIVFLKEDKRLLRKTVNWNPTQDQSLLAASSTV